MSLLDAARAVVDGFEVMDATGPDFLDEIKRLRTEVEEAEQQCHPLFARDPIDDCRIIRCDVEGTVYSRDEVAHAKLDRIIGMLTGGHGNQ